MQTPSMLMFSALTLTGAQLPAPITLPRTQTFPSRQFDYLRGVFIQQPHWIPEPIRENGAHLSLKLGELLGSGRSALVYAASIVSVTPGNGGGDESVSIPTPIDQELCVKVARPNRCRTLAREGWICELLREGRWQGVMTPRYYGFFTAELSKEQLPFPLWSSTEWDKKQSSGYWKSIDPTRDDDLPDDDLPDDDLPDDDLLDDEPPDDEPLPEEYADQPPGNRELSPWMDWKPDSDAPLLSVLVMARGGQQYSVATDDWDRDTQKDVLQVLHDLSLAFIVHRDLRPANLIRAPPDTLMCPRHKCVHKWHIIDFPWSLVDVKCSDRANRVKKIKIISELQSGNYRAGYFYAGHRNVDLWT